MTEHPNKECKEYNSLKYKTMIMTGQNIDNKITNESSQQQLHDFLLNEKMNNQKQTWSKLSKTEKIRKIDRYIKETLNTKHRLTAEESDKLKTFVHNLIERRRLIKSTEICYDEDTGMVVDIPAVSFNSKARRFTLNREVSQTTNKSTTQRRTKKTR